MRCRLVPCRVFRALLLAGLTFALPACAAELSGQVKAATGEPLAARVLIMNAETRESVVLYTDLQGNFKSEVPAGQLHVLATHGPEWTLAERDARGGDRLELLLTRLVDMPARGYYGADFHMHSTISDGKQTPAEVAANCRAEGLQVAALTDHHQVAQQQAWLACAAPGFLPLRGQEFSTRFGHVVAVNNPTLIQTPMNAATDWAAALGAIHADGGFALVAHPCIPGMVYQAPEIRDYEAVEILNGSVPPYGGIFDFAQARKYWHALLSKGLRVAAVGDSDNHDNLSGLAREIIKDPEAAMKRDARLAMIGRMVDVQKTIIPWAWKGLHPGFYRTYLQLPEQTAAAVASAVKGGRGFVTNGPLLVATLDGQPPGSEIAVNGRAAVTFGAEVFANRPLERLVLVVNGKEATSLGSNAARVEVSLPLKPGDWVTAELYGPWPEFATTNAWYVK